jgi:hypothetical protein
MKSLTLPFGMVSLLCAAIIATGLLYGRGSLDEKPKEVALLTGIPRRSGQLRFRRTANRWLRPVWMRWLSCGT